VNREPRFGFGHPAEQRAVRLFLALAGYVAIDAGRALVRREAPSESVVGIILAALWWL